MDINLMHISIKQSLQKINAYMYRDILPQEIDLFINKAMERIVLSRYSYKSNKKQEGFEESQLRTEDLGNLVKDPYVDDVVLLTKQHGKVEGVSNYGEIEEDNKYIFPLPEDYFILTRQRAKVFFNDCNDVGFLDDSGNATTDMQTKLRNVTCYPISLPTNDEVVGFSVIDEVEISGDDSYVLEFDEALTIPEDVEAIKQAMIDKMRSKYVSNAESDTKLLPNDGANKDSNLYNEVYKEAFYSNKVLYVRSGFHNDDIDVVFSESGGSGTYTITVKPEKRVFRYIDESNLDSSTGSWKYSTIKMRNSNDINVFNNTFHSPDSDSINAVEYKRFLELHSDGTFVPMKCNISYIKKLKNVSYERGVDCVLNEHMHDQVIDDTVDLIRNVVENKNYQLGVLENLKKE